MIVGMTISCLTSAYCKDKNIQKISFVVLLGITAMIYSEINEQFILKSKIDDGLNGVINNKTIEGIMEDYRVSRGIEYFSVNGVKFKYYKRHNRNLLDTFVRYHAIYPKTNAKFKSFQSLYKKSINEVKPYIKLEYLIEGKYETLILRAYI